VLGEVRVGIFAKEFIKAGTELTYNYNFEWYGGAKVRCRCGAPSCVGFLGAKSRAFQVFCTEGFKCLLLLVRCILEECCSH
jgi:histone-lysine N-methyltransferase SETD2